MGGFSISLRLADDEPEPDVHPAVAAVLTAFGVELDDDEG